MVPATIMTTNTLNTPFDTPLPPFAQFSTPTPLSQLDYHMHYQAQFQAIASQLAAIQQSQIQLPQLFNSQTNRQNTQPIDRPNQHTTNNLNSDIQEQHAIADRATRLMVKESSYSMPIPWHMMQETSHQTSGHHTSSLALNLAQQLAALK